MTIDGLIKLLIDINEGENPKIEYNLHGRLSDITNCLGGLDDAIVFFDDVRNAEEYKHVREV